MGLILVAAVVAGFGRRELFDLAREDPARSVRRFASGAAEVHVMPRLPWARVPALLPGPADEWAGGATHAITVPLQPRPGRALVLYVQTSRARPPALAALPPPSATGQPAHLRVLVNGMGVAAFDTPGIGDPPAPEAPRAATLARIAIPATALGSGSTAHLALVNDGPASVALRRVRLVEAIPTFALGHLALGGRFPFVSAGLLAAGLSLLLWGSLQVTRGGSGGRHLLPALGPGLGLLLLGLAVIAPSPARAVPRWAWLLLIFSVLLGSRPRLRPAAPSRATATGVTRTIGNAVLALSALAISLVAAEYALRTAFRDEPWAAQALGIPYVDPNKGPPNSLGFDEREFPLQKPRGVYRIAILGDSLSVSAPRPRRFGNVVTELLNARSPRAVTYESVSFGTAGVDTNEEVEILHRSVWQTDPDFVLLEWYVNDLENGDHGGRSFASRLIPGDEGLGRWLRQQADRTLLYWMLQRQYDALQERLELFETYPAYLHRRFGDPAGPDWQFAAIRLREFIDECRAHHTPVAIALFPHLSAGLPTGAYEFGELHDNVLALCRTQSIPCVDLSSAFAAYQHYTTLWASRYDPHPNERAHRIAAERLVEVLGPLWLEGRQDHGGRPTGGATLPSSGAVGTTNAKTRWTRIPGNAVDSTDTGT